jgi:hypothetical protein
LQPASADDLNCIRQYLAVLPFELLEICDIRRGSSPGRSIYFFYREGGAFQPLDCLLGRLLISVAFRERILRDAGVNFSDPGRDSLTAPVSGADSNILDSELTTRCRANIADSAISRRRTTEIPP